MDSENKMAVIIVGLIAWAIASTFMAGLVADAYKARFKDPKPCICGQVN